MGVTILRRREVTVLPHRAKEVLSKAENAHAVKETDMHIVFPLRTAPSQIIASRFLWGLDGHHQLRTSSCFREKLSNERAELLLTVLTVRMKSFCAVFKSAEKVRTAFALNG